MNLLLLLACTTQPPSAPPPTPAPATPPSGHLLWVSEASGEVNTVFGGADASDPKPLVQLQGAVFPGPADPQKTHALLVHAVGEGEAHLETLLLVPLTGGEPIQLGPTASAVRNPVWSADGSHIYYESSALSFRDLYRVDRLGRNPKRITETEQGSFDPSVRADGRVVFASSIDGVSEIYSMASDGTDRVRLTQDTFADQQPRWSPDGSSIAWLSRHGPVVSAWRMQADGSHQEPFRFKPGVQEVDQALSWSPDGKLLCVTVQIGPETVVLDLLDASGKLVRRIAPRGVSEHPTWSPDGRWLVFNTSGAQNAPELYRVDVTVPDAPIERLTTNTHADWLARWID